MLVSPPRYISNDPNAGQPVRGPNSSPTTGPGSFAPTDPSNPNTFSYQQLWQQAGQDVGAYLQLVRERLNISQGHQSDPTSLLPLQKALQAVGVDAQLDQRSDGLHKGLMIGGQFVKMLDGSDNWIYQPGGDSAGGGQQPFNYPTWNEQFSYPDFVAPTAATEANDPGYEAGLKQGIDALQRSAASKGTLLTGATAKQLERFGTDYQNQQLGQITQRDLGIWGTNYNKNAGEYNQRYQQYLNGFNNALTGYSTNFGVDQSLWGRALAENQNGFAQQFSLAQLGAGAAGGANNAAGNYGNAASGIYQGIGNAQAAGQIGGANAWQNYFSQLPLIYASLYGNRRPNSFNYPNPGGQ